LLRSPLSFSHSVKVFLFAPRVCGVRALRVPTRDGPQLLRLRPSSAAGAGVPSVSTKDRVTDTPAPIRTLGTRSLRSDRRFTRGAEVKDPLPIAPRAEFFDPVLGYIEGIRAGSWRRGAWRSIRPAGHRGVVSRCGWGVLIPPVPWVADLSGARGSRTREPNRGDGGAAVCERRGAPVRIALVRSRAEESAGAGRGGAPACRRPPWHRQENSRHAVKRKNRARGQERTHSTECNKRIGCGAGPRE
jgi:hypothetical protein